MPKKASRNGATKTAERPAMHTAPQQVEAARRAPFAPGTMQTLRTPSDVQLSPDGKSVAFLVREWVPGRAKPRGRLWLAPVKSAEAHPIAVAAGEDAGPRWSPDGKRLAFLSTRDEPANDAGTADKREKFQISITTLSDGEAQGTRRVCIVPNGASDLAWSPDGSRITFISPEGAEPGTDPLILGNAGEDRHRRLWAVRPESDTPEPLTPPDVTIWEYAWSPDGETIAVFFATRPGETDYYRGQIGLVPAGGGAVRQVTRLTRQAAALTWAPDSSRIAYISGEWSDRGIVGGDVFTLALHGLEARGEPKNLTPGIACSPSWVRWLPDGGRLLYAAWDGLSHAIGVLDEASGKTTPLQKDFAIGEWAWPRLSASADLRRIAVMHSDPEANPFDVFVGDVSASGITWRRLTRLNPIAEETLARSPSRRIEYTGADGWHIQALFNPPTEWKGQGKPPLALIVHGGPSGAYQDTWTGGFLAQMLAGAGYAVLRPNPRGSMGRGVAFTDAVLGDMGGKDYQDVLAGVDYVVEQGWVDGERVAILGWSYGGFMVAWAVSQAGRFKAAMMGAGVCDYHSFHAQSNIPDWDMRFLGADPSERPEVYRERSAITYARNLATPTLIIHGEKDLCVPVNQAYAFQRALAERGVPVELAVYPREGHGFQEREHIKDMEERILRWLAKYV